MRILEGEQSLNNLKERIKGDEVGRGVIGGMKRSGFICKECRSVTAGQIISTSKEI